MNAASAPIERTPDSTTHGRFRVYQRGLRHRSGDRIVYVSEVETFVCRRPNRIRWVEEWRKPCRKPTGPDEIEIVDRAGNVLARSLTTRDSLRFVSNDETAELFRINRIERRRDIITWRENTEPFHWNFRGGGFLFRKPVTGELFLSWLTVRSGECRYGFTFSVTPADRMLEAVALLYLTCRLSVRSGV